MVGKQCHHKHQTQRCNRAESGLVGGGSFHDLIHRLGVSKAGAEGRSGTPKGQMARVQAALPQKFLDRATDLYRRSVPISLGPKCAHMKKIIWTPSVPASQSLPPCPLRSFKFAP